MILVHSLSRSINRRPAVTIARREEELVCGLIRMKAIPAKVMTSIPVMQSEMIISVHVH